MIPRKGADSADASGPGFSSGADSGRAPRLDDVEGRECVGARYREILIITVKNLLNRWTGLIQPVATVLVQRMRPLYLIS